MSWCRWGAKCANTMLVYDCDLACKNCPGSDLYVYADVNDPEGSVRCCGCALMEGPDDEDFTPQHFVAANHESMLDHLEHHVMAGHHVRASLRQGADLKEAGWRSLQSIMGAP